MAQIEAAIAHLNRQETLNYAEAARAYGIDPITLARRHKGLTVSPTTQIIKNLVEEILKGPVGKNWTSRFIKCHSTRICSLYLRPLDRSRVFVESVTIFERFYVLV